MFESVPPNAVGTFLLWVTLACAWGIGNGILMGKELYGRRRAVVKRGSSK